jgi:hypothetical protein
MVGTTEQMLEPVSTRSGQISQAAQPLADAFEARMGRPMNALERRKLLDEVARTTRSRKDLEHQETLEQRAARLAAGSMADAGMVFGQVADQLLVSSAAGPVQAEAFSPESVIKEALAQVAESSVWSRHQLTRQILTLLPPLGDVSADQVLALAKQLGCSSLAGQLLPWSGPWRCSLE